MCKQNFIKFWAKCFVLNLLKHVIIGDNTMNDHSESG